MPCDAWSARRVCFVFLGRNRNWPSGTWTCPAAMTRFPSWSSAWRLHPPVTTDWPQRCKRGGAACVRSCDREGQCGWCWLPSPDPAALCMKLAMLEPAPWSLVPSPPPHHHTHTRIPLNPQLPPTPASSPFHSTRLLSFEFSVPASMAEAFEEADMGTTPCGVPNTGRLQDTLAISASVMASIKSAVGMEATAQ